MREPFTRKERAALWRLIVYIGAVPLAALAVALGGPLAVDHGYAGEGGTEPEYTTRGWPIRWLTNAPNETIATSFNDDEWSGVNEQGVAVTVLVGTFTAWYLAALITAYAASLATRSRVRLGGIVRWIPHR